MIILFLHIYYKLNKDLAFCTLFAGFIGIFKWLAAWKNRNDSPCRPTRYLHRNFNGLLNISRLSFYALVSYSHRWVNTWVHGFDGKYSPQRCLKSRAYTYLVSRSRTFPSRKSIKSKRRGICLAATPPMLDIFIGESRRVALVRTSARRNFCNYLPSLSNSRVCLPLLLGGTFLVRSPAVYQDPFSHTGPRIAMRGDLNSDLVVRRRVRRALRISFVLRSGCA